MSDNPIETFNVDEILAALPLFDLTREPAATDDNDPFPLQAPFGAGGLYIGSFVGLTPWENHVDTDELLYAVEGEVELTILSAAGSQQGVLRQGCACIVPKGIWHRQFARNPVRLMTISGPGPVSWADDPRTACIAADAP